MVRRKGVGSTHAHDRAAGPDAFGAFYDRAFGDVYRYVARALLGNRGAAEDVTQETFAAVVAAVLEGRPEALTMPWVMGVARHKVIDHIRRAEREQHRLALAWSARGPDPDDLETELDGEDPARVVALLRDLSSAHRIVLVLRYLDDLPVDEIAALLGRSVHATESLLVRARHALARSHREVTA